jgi:hypothetical protein
MTDQSARIGELGDALFEAASADLKHPARRGRKRRILGLLAAATVLVPAGALGANALLTNDDVARSLPAGKLALVGTTPTCQVVVDQIEYRCVLDRPPSPNQGGPADGWKGTVEPSVDASNHVSGGCRALDEQGITWQCYLGEAAVEQRIISHGFLGDPVSGPGVG